MRYLRGAHDDAIQPRPREARADLHMAGDSVRRGRKLCQQIGGIALDQAISALLIELMRPMTMDIALAAQREIEARIGENDVLRRTQLERARYEAELARCR